MTPQRVHRLLNWCEARGIILSNIELVDHSEQDGLGIPGISVVARHDLSHLDMVAKIPKSTVLSKRTSEILAKVPGIDTAGDDLMELSLVLAYEIAIGKKSKWFGYLQSLPEEVPVAALWEGNSDQDSQTALSWLKGTETSFVINPPGATSSISQNVSRYYYQIASQTLTSLGHNTTLLDFQRAWSLVSSRSFRVDAYHGLAMVPIADAFNHIAENQVHIETDFDVCPTCGALQFCPHDEEGEDTDLQGLVSTEGVSLILEDTCDMVINAPIEAGDEVFNSYDANLPNSVLLARYGFILEGNEFDYLSWDSTNLPQNMQNCTTARWEDLARAWTADLLAETSLVYDPTEKPATLALRVGSLTHGRNVPQYKLNADGLVSVDLWVLAAACSLKVTGISSVDIVSRSRLERLATAQVCAENREHRDNPDSGISVDALLELKLVASLIQDMCRSRLLGMYRPELSSAECGDILDSLPNNMSRSRLAIAQALSERATLAACIDGWQDLLDCFDKAQT